MNFSRDFFGDPIVREMPYINGTYVVGQIMAMGLTDGTNLGSLFTGANATDAKWFAGVCQEAVTTTGTVALGSLDAVKTIINPTAFYMIPVDLSAGITPTNSPSTTSVPFTCTSAMGHSNAGGSWMYRITDPGAGELNWIESSSHNSSTTCTLVPHTTSVATTTASRFVIIPGVGQRCIPMNATTVDGDAIDVDTSATAQVNNLYAYMAVVIGTYLQSKGRVLQELRTGTPRTHVNLTDLDSDSVRFWVEASFAKSSMWFGIPTLG